ncbi:hypothetical protein ACFCWY_08600 [Streptomyces sp. NPDC056362]|uniref:hypothetical protein n=1 Tax=unclassified Streptomyces TaxID=2593676 RepID=UPI0035E30EE9
MSSTTTTSGGGGRFYMRTVNRGTPERVTAEAAHQEVKWAESLRAKQLEAEAGTFSRPPVEVFSSQYAEGARIDYHAAQGVVELRPATAEETAMVVRPEGERYAPGDRVIVRGTWYEYPTNTHHVLPEYEGVVSAWYGGRYLVRAVEPDEDGITYGSRECRVRELRPVGVDVEAARKASGLNIGDRVWYPTRTVEFPEGPRGLAPGRGRLRDVWVSQGEVVARVELAEPYRSLMGGVSDAPPLSVLLRDDEPPKVVQDARRLAVNLVVEERARTVLETAGFVEGHGGFVFRTDAVAVRLRATDLGDDEWMSPRGKLWRCLSRKDWRVGLSSDSAGPYLCVRAPSQDLTNVIAEGKRREVETAHGEALAENGQRDGDTVGTIPEDAQEARVVAALDVLRAAGVRLAVFPGRKLLYREWHSPQGPQGALVLAETRTGVEVRWLINGAGDEKGMRSRDTKAVRPARNTALDEIADAFSAAGWSVWRVESRNTATRRALSVAVTPRDDA